MSDSPSSSAPRRSQREKKIAKPFGSIDSSVKRKRNDSDTEEDALDEDAPPPDDAEEEQEEYHAAKPKPKGPPAAKKPRTAAPKPATRKPRKTKNTADAFDAAQIAKETKITDDNPIFNSIMNPQAPLQTTAEDFLESLSQSPAAAQAELINFILRACGCNDSVDSDEVMDYDGVVDALDNFTEGLKKDDSPVYPLTSKLPIFKKFRKSLSEFIERTIAASADLGLLYTTDLMPTLQTWVVAMSSSQIRSFRHTATVVALEVETALCEVAAAVEKEAEVVARQREGERKRKASNKGKGAGVRDKELEGKAEEVRERRTKLAEFLKEFVDGVFVHRYRDLDPHIRAECVRSIGHWFQSYPSHFLDGAYLRYVGWVLSDSNTQVRLEAVKALSAVYEPEQGQGQDYIASGSLNHFTERFKGRLVEMARGDTEVGVRVAVIGVLGAVDGHGLLEDGERESLCLLVFDKETKVRKAVSGFVSGVWEDSVGERLVGRKANTNKKEKERVGIKALADLFVKWGKSLDKFTGDKDEEDDDDDEGAGNDGGERKKRKQVVALVGLEQKGRTALAVEALWDAVEPVRDWEGLLDILLLDHSPADEDSNTHTRGRRTNGKTNGKDSVVDEAWRLEEVEESALLEVLVASLRRARIEAASGKKGEEESVSNDITRELIKGLPQLFIKHQTDQKRIADVLLIPCLMNLDLYLEMRMITAYASLWDDVTKQLLSHSSLTVIKNAVGAIRHLMEATSLSNTNSTKILELEDELSSALRDAVAAAAGDEIEVASFTEDEVLSLGALCSRLNVLVGIRDMTAWMEENEGGKQSSAWDIVSAIAERGRLGYKEEELMIDQALNLLTMHLFWKAQRLNTDVEPDSDLVRTLGEQRDSLLEKLIEYAVGTQSNTVEGIKRAAFQNLMHIHILFCASETVAADGTPLPIASLKLELDDEVQYRCAGFIQAEIERYAEDIDDGVGAGADAEGSEDEDEDSSEEDGAESEPAKGKKRKNAKNKNKKKPEKEKDNVDLLTRSRLEKEYVFIGVMATFLRAICANVIHVRHGAIFLAHYGRLGPTFDTCSKAIVDVLRDEGMYKNNGEVVATVVTQALQESFTLVLDGVVHDESHSVALAKLFNTAFVVRGSQLSILRRLDSQFVVEIHTTLLTWIGKRLTAYQTNKNKKSLKTGVLFFRVLLPLLVVIQSRDALRIKAHMDQILAQAKVEISPTSKIWDPQRAYEKRLGTAMSKDKVPATKGRKMKVKGTASAAAVTSEEEGSDAEKLADETNAPEPPVRPKPRPKRATRARPAKPAAGDMDSEAPEDDDPATPKAKTRPKATYKVKTPTKPHDEPSHPSPTGSATMSEAELDEPTTPQASRKRVRSEEPEEEVAGAESAGQANGSPSILPPQPTPATPVGEIQIRRKRARH